MTSPPPFRTLADDLSGAVEVAALLSSAAEDAEVVLAGSRCPARNTQGGAVTVVDLHVRDALPETVRAVAGRTTEALGGADFVKIDSLLRGSPAELVGAAASVRPVVVCPALPAAGRSTVGGRLRSPGLPAHDGRALTGLTPVGLDDVRGDPAELGDLVAAANASGRPPVCDAETDADLDRIVAAGTTLSPVTYVGSGGMAAALRRARRPLEAPRSPVPPAGCAPVLAVVGSAEDSARTQVDLLAARGALVVTASGAGEDAGRLARAVHGGLAGGPVVLTADRTPVDGARSAGLAGQLGAVARTVADRRPGVRLFLTGGQTARSVLDALGVRVATVVGQVDLGAVHCRTDTGHDVVTRPGSMGGPDALLTAVEYLGGIG